MDVLESFETLLPALSTLNLGPEEALAEQVAPLLYFASPETAPSSHRRAYYDTAARNLALLDGLEELTAALGARGIRPIVLKGADLATSLYPNIALRPMSDVDVWVERDEISATEQTLSALGYRAGCPEMAPGLVRAVKHARLYVKGVNDSIAVDLHWSLVGHDDDRRAPDLAWFRSHAREMRLDATAHLLYLAAHMKLQHYDERPSLLWLFDFCLLAREKSVRWDELVEAARAFGWTPALAATATEVEDRLGVLLPEPLAALAALARDTAWTADGSARPPARKGGPQRAWNELSTLDWRGRASLVRGYLAPSPAYIRFRYQPSPAWIWPLYYPLRWARVAAGVCSLAVPKRRSRPLLGESF
jgi:Uncharacterised nucleotidyltransferase